jgi:ABC-2 type transport system permease protein
MTVLFFELKQGWRSTVWWSLGLGAVTFLFAGAMYPIYYEQVNVIKPMFEAIPEVVLRSLGVNLDILFTSLGFFSFVMMYLHLIAGMQGILLGLGVIGKELRLKMMDFILTRPMSRSQVFIQKTVAIWIHLTLTWMIFSGIAYLSLVSFSKEAMDWVIFGQLSVSLYAIQLLFMAIGALIATLLRKLKSVIGVGLSVVFALFIMNLMQSIFEEEWLRYLSPFQWFERGYLFVHNAFEWPMIGMWVLVSVGSLIAAYLVYVKKDVHAV